MKNPFLSEDVYIPWSHMSAEKIVTDVTIALSKAKRQINYAVQEKEPTYSNVIEKISAAKNTLSDTWTRVRHLSDVCGTPEFRAEYKKMLPNVSDFYSSLYLNEELFQQVDSVYQNKSELSLLKQRHLEEIHSDFVLNGATLSKSNKEKLANINRKLAMATQQFSENALESKEAWTYFIDEEDKLEGLPKSTKDTAHELAVRKGYCKELPGWLFTLDTSMCISVLRHIEDSEVRKKMWEGIGTIGTNEKWNNSSLILEILSLRKQKATTLGFKHFPDFVLAKRMAQNGKKALGFVNDFYDRIKDQFNGEISELEEWMATQKGTEVKPFCPWDYSYWANQMRKVLHDYDAELLRPYLSIDGVLEGIFAIVNDLYGIEVSLLPSKFVGEGESLPDGCFDIWHESVQVYEVREGGKRLGVFYTDWFPREGKRSGAWMNPIHCSVTLDDGTVNPHIGIVCGNLDSPTPGKPALLTFSNIVTMFHEFGHLFHHLLGTVEVADLNGTNVAWDFVELPSQIMENWCFEYSALERFAKHYETGETLPKELFDKMNNARKFLTAQGTMRQLAFGKMDLELHLLEDEKFLQNLDEKVREIITGYTIPFACPDNLILYRFGHIFGNPIGYASGYYSYKWAEVLEADAYSKFLSEGIFNREVGMDFRAKILSQGNAKPPEELFRDFVGREPSLDALLIREGLDG
jgi:oligopeptidase A